MPRTIAIGDIHGCSTAHACGTTSLRDIIESVWRWHEQHPEGYVS